MKRVKCKSGIYGSQGKLQKMYSSYKEFESYDEMFGLARRLGFDTAQDAWDENPTIQVSVNPDDFCKVNV
jgi:hypothetical protein